MRWPSFAAALLAAVAAMLSAHFNRPVEYLVCSSFAIAAGWLGWQTWVVADRDYRAEAGAKPARKGVILRSRRLSRSLYGWPDSEDVDDYHLWVD